jgi:lipopolysaccharide biosynthesis glycosyltransferase
MKTGAEGIEIRPYFNAGFFILKTDRKILQFWKDRVFTILEHKEMHAFFDQHVLYKIFIHQAVLTGAVLASTTAAERQLLPYNVNYPIYFHDQHPYREHVKSSDDLVSCRYDTYFNQDDQTFPFSEEMKALIDPQALKLGWFYE